MNIRTKIITEKYVYSKGSTNLVSYQYDFFSIPYHTTLQENEDDQNVSVYGVGGLKRASNSKRDLRGPLLPQL